jgi:hypothetical protein
MEINLKKFEIVELTMEHSEHDHVSDTDNEKGLTIEEAAMATRGHFRQQWRAQTASN